MSLARNIHERRAQKRMSQQELAARSGITQAQISRLESGREENATLQTLRALAYALGCSVVALLPDEDKRRQLSPPPDLKRKGAGAAVPDSLQLSGPPAE